MNSYNSETFAGGEALLTSTQDNISINGYGLQNEYISTSLYEENNIIDLQSFDFPKTNGRGLLGYYNRGKTITLRVTVTGDDAEDFNNRLDELRKNIFKSEVNLDIKVNGVVRRIKASCISSSKVLEFYNITFGTFDVEFETLEPFFYEISYQTSSFLNKTANFNEEISNNGTAIADLLIFFIFKTGISGVNDITVTIGSKAINITETINDNDVLIINGETKEVKINGIVKDYIGEFPTLDINSNIINFEINGTYDVDINCLNKVYYV